MMMMMPMLMNSDGSFNQQVPQQFMPMPMASMGAHLFNNMMVMPPPPQAASQTPADQLDQQQREQQDKVSPQDEQDEQKPPAQPKEDSADGPGKPLGAPAPFDSNGLHDVTREATIGPPTSFASTSTPSPVDNQKDKSSICVESKIKPASLDETKDISHQTKLRGRARTTETASLCSEKRKSNDNQSKSPSLSDEPQQQPASTNLEIKEVIETPAASLANGIETERSCLDETKSLRVPSNETTSEFPSQIMANFKSNSPGSPATNIPNPEKKLFPSPATPSPETVLIEKETKTIDATRDIELEEGGSTDSPPRVKANQKLVETAVKQETETSHVQTKEKNASEKDQGTTQTTESLASTLLGLSKYSE